LRTNTAIPLNSWCWLQDSAEGMWHGLHQKTFSLTARGRRLGSGYVHRLGRAELRERGWISRCARGAAKKSGGVLFVRLNLISLYAFFYSVCSNGVLS